MKLAEINARIEVYVLKLKVYEFKDYTIWENVEPVLMWLKKHYLFIEFGNQENKWWVNVPMWRGFEFTEWEIIAREETLPLVLVVASLKSVGEWDESLRN